MKGGFAPVGVVALLLASGALAPASAGAKASPPPRSQPVAEFELKGSGGYSLTFVGGGRSVALRATRGLGATVSYETRGRVTPGGIEATFGALGKVVVEFRPSGRVRRKPPPRRCRGTVRKTYPGVFVGAIRFRGEQGYTRARANRVNGSMELRSAWRCKGGRGGKGEARRPQLPDLDGESAVLQATSTRGRLVFGVVAYRPPEERGITLFAASSTERRTGMTIERTAITFGPDRAFAFDVALGTATASPPRPFGGGATLAPGPGGTTAWTGSLKVDLPGRKNVPLATPSFTANLSPLPG